MDFLLCIKVCVFSQNSVYNYTNNMNTRKRENPSKDSIAVKYGEFLYGKFRSALIIFITMLIVLIPILTIKTYGKKSRPSQEVFINSQTVILPTV